MSNVGSNERNSSDINTTDVDFFLPIVVEKCIEFLVFLFYSLVNCVIYLLIYFLQFNEDFRIKLKLTTRKSQKFS